MTTARRPPAPPDPVSGPPAGRRAPSRPSIADPRIVPLDVDPADVLPALPSEALTGAALRRRFALRPAWEPEILDDSWRADGLQPVPAAVLIPLFDRPSGPGLLLTERSTALARHGGQIAFPGGRVDPGDGSPIAAALREAEEEVGLPPERVEVLGALPEYRTGTGYAVTPIVGLIDGGVELASLRPSPAEVAEIFEVPLLFLMDPANHQRRLFRWSHADGQWQRRFFTMPWRPDPSGEREYFIWGATAAMLRNLYRFLAVPLPSNPAPDPSGR